MTFANRLKVAENLPISSREGFQRNSRPTFWLKSIFVGPNGLRAGWRVLMFIALFAVSIWKFRSHPSRRASRLSGAVQEPKSHYDHAACDGWVGRDHLAVSLCRCAGHGQT